MNILNFFFPKPVGQVDWQAEIAAQKAKVDNTWEDYFTKKQVKYNSIISKNWDKWMRKLLKDIRANRRQFFQIDLCNHKLGDYIYEIKNEPGILKELCDKNNLHFYIECGCLIIMPK